MLVGMRMETLAFLVPLIVHLCTLTTPVMLVQGFCQQGIAVSTTQEQLDCGTHL